MTNRITNKNGVKLYAAVMVLAIAFAGVALISSESTYAESNVATIVSDAGESDRMSFDNAVSNVTTGQTIKLYGNVEKDTLYTIADGVTIDGQTNNTIKLTGSNQIRKSITIINATLDGPAWGIGFTSDNSTYILKNVVTKELTFFYDQATTLQAEGCTFEKGVQLQINGDGNKYSFADCSINELQISNTTRDTIISGTYSEAIDDPVIIIDQETQVNELSGVSGGKIKLQDCTLNVDRINQYLWNADNGFYDNPNGRVEIGDNVHLVPINEETVDFGDIEIITPYSDSTDALGLKSYLENDFTISKKAFLADDLVIKEGVTLTVASTGSLDLNGHKLILEGNLIVANGGIVSAPFPGTESTNTIEITKTGTITNSGIIGKDNGIVVTVDAGDDSESGTALMDNVSGVELGLTKVVGDEVTYYLTVSGTVSKKTNSHSLKIDNAYISDLDIRDLTKAIISDSFITKNGSLDIGSKSTVSIENLTLEAGATLTVDGKITGTDATVSMKDGATAVINGNASEITFSAKTGEYDTYDTETGKKNVAEDKLTTSSAIEVAGLNGLTVDVTSKVFTENRITKTEQMLNIYGVASFVKEGTTTASEGTIAVMGEVHTPAGKELTLAKEDMEFTFADDAKILTEGIVKTATAISKFEGATYSVKNADGTFTYHYTTFDNAYAEIANADMKKVTIKGGYTFAKEYTVAAEQTIEFTDDAEYKISKDGKVTVADEGTMSGKFVSTGTAGIQGILVVMNGASCTPASGSYEVKSVDTDGTVTYSGAAWAIENAISGSTIDIVGAVTFEEKVTVSEGVTVNVKEGATISAKEGMAVNGKVLNGGEITIEGGKNLEVAGTVDNTDGDMIFEDGSEVTVTGLFLGNIAEGTKVNAAKYQGDVTTYTSVAKAVEASAAMDIPEPVEALGKITETSDITLGEGMVLTITGEVVLNSVRLEAGATLNVAGTLTSDVIGAVGKADTTGAVSDAVIDLNKATKVESKLNYNESNSTSTLVLTIGTEYAGAVKVEKGVVSVDIPDEFALGTTASFAIGSEATVQLSKADVSITDATRKAFINEGTLNVQKNMTISGTIGGTVIVKEGITLTLKSEDSAKTVVVGDITLTQKDDKKAKLKVDGEVRVGTTPTTLGAAGSISGEVEFTNVSYAIVFEGSTFTSATEGLKSTSYSVNGIALGTVYTTNSISIDVMNPVVEGLGDLITPANAPVGTTVTIKWMSGAEDVSGNVGFVEAVNATLDYQSVLVKVSEGPGLQVYIDDVKTDGSEKLAIGTHTITVYLEPNYEGTPVIKLNGVTITDGTFEITTDMMGGDNKIVVTGATYVQPTTPVTPVQPIVSSDDDDMGLTEYLLIVLVILAAILVVVVAIRMMRS